MKLRIEPYALSGAVIVCDQMMEWDQKVYEAFYGEDFDVDQCAAATTLYGEYKWLGVDEQNQPQWVGGFTRQRPGVFRTWFYSTPACWKVGYKSMTRGVRDLIATFRGRCHRIETLTLAGNSPLERWYASIGLTYEGTLCKYGANGSDFVIFTTAEK